MHLTISTYNKKIKNPLLETFKTDHSFHCIERSFIYQKIVAFNHGHLILLIPEKL